MKKNIRIVAGCLLAAVTAVSALLWQTGTAMENVPAAPVQTAVCAAVEPPATVVAEAQPEPRTIAPVEHSPEPEISAINNAEAILPDKKEMSEPVLPRKAKPKGAPISAEPRNGDMRMIDGEAQIYILGFGWIKNESGGAQGTTDGNHAADMYENGSKIGVMGGGKSIDGGGDINKMVGIMGVGDAPPSTPRPEPPPVTGEAIDQTINKVPVKSSTPPDYIPQTAPPAGSVPGE